MFLCVTELRTAWTKVCELCDICSGFSVVFWVPFLIPDGGVPVGWLPVGKGGICLQQSHMGVTRVHLGSLMLRCFVLAGVWHVLGTKMMILDLITC